MIDPEDPPETQIFKQSKIIDALIRRAGRQREVSRSAYSAFQSAIDLQEKVAAQSRDLERAASELASARYERERTRKNLADALATMEEGFALFRATLLDVCNDLFRALLPDVSGQIEPGLNLANYLKIMTTSAHLVSTDRGMDRLRAAVDRLPTEIATHTVILELSDERWFQMHIETT